MMGTSFGALVRDLRLQAGLTQEALAERAGISARGIRALEGGKSRPYVETVQRLIAGLALCEADAARLLTMVTSTPRRRGPSAREAGVAPPPDPARSLGWALPAPPTPLIGRAAEIAAVAALLQEREVRLVTLTGPGGVGKTRLALAVAAEIGTAFADGAAFVPLASLADPALVPAALARALDVRESANRSPWEGVLAALRTREMLILLDNFEHLLTAAPRLAELLAACPRLSLLVTSRGVLHLRAERRFEVSTLAVPATDQPDDPAISSSAAVALFVARAQAAQPDFSLTEGNTAPVAAICRRLEGLPLAIELVAPRMRLLSPAALLVRLERRLDLLIGGAHDLPERQKTLRATLDWSFGLLHPEEQALLRRLAVFTGGCSVEAVEAVCGGADVPDGDLIERLGGLVDQSLLRRQSDEDGEPRLAMLETVREYAAERLTAAGEVAAVEERHAAYYLALAEAAGPELAGPGQRAWLARLEREHDNLRAALRWCAREDARMAMGARLAGALLDFWWMRGHWREGRQWLEEMATAHAAAAPQARARALYGAGVLVEALGDHARAATLYAESRALYASMGDQRGIAISLIGLGAVSTHRGEVATARSHLEESLALVRELGEQRLTAHALVNLGSLALVAGDVPAAEALLEESLALYRAVDDRWGIGMPINVLGTLALRRGDTARAWALFQESLLHYWDVGNPIGSATCLEGLALVAAAHDPLGAARLLGAAGAAHEANGAARPPLIATDYAYAVSRIRAALGEAAFGAAFAEGHTLTLDEAIPLAVQAGMPGRRPSPRQRGRRRCYAGA